MSRTWRRDEDGFKRRGDVRRNKRKEKHSFDDPFADSQNHSRNRKYNSNLDYRDFDLDDDMN